MTHHVLRAARSEEIEYLALLWHSGWQDAHAAILPAELARLRTLESFRQRISDHLGNTTVADSAGRAVGFCTVLGDELYQLFVSREARGKGIAAALLGDGERRIAATGATSAWLACAIGNERAMRFYEKSGWTRAGRMVNQLSTPAGPYSLEVWRYEKQLSQSVSP